MELPRFVSGVLVVPPCDCVWLTGDEFYLSGSRRLCFEAKAKHDVTIILRNSPGTKRLEHSLPQGSETCSYTIKIGSHRNTAVEFERNGVTVSSAKTTALDQWLPRFASFWVQLCYGVLTVGSGEPRSCNVIHRWKVRVTGYGMRHTRSLSASHPLPVIEEGSCGPELLMSTARLPIAEAHNNIANLHCSLPYVLMMRDRTLLREAG